MRALSGLRRFLPGTLLLVVAAALAASFRVQEFHQKLQALRRSAGVPASLSRLLATGFAFDPGYAPFLEAVRRLTPENAAVAVVAPKTSELYVYQAVYTLAPRRVVGAGEARQAQYIALYGTENASGFPPGSPIPNGTLARR